MFWTKEWAPQEWMEPYLDLLGGREKVVRLMSGPRADASRKITVALDQRGMEEKIGLLVALHDSGMLT